MEAIIGASGRVETGGGGVIIDVVVAAVVVEVVVVVVEIVVVAPDPEVPDPEEDADEEIDIQEDNFQTVRRTVHDEIIPNNTVTVLIEDICIEKTINLSDELILNDIGEIPIDVDNLESEDENVLLPNDDNNISGKNSHHSEAKKTCLPLTGGSCAISPISKVGIPPKGADVLLIFANSKLINIKV